MMRVLIEPFFKHEDKGDGGIRRVVEAQRKWLPKYGIDVVNHVDEADLVALHAGNWVETTKPVVAHCHGLYWEGYEWEKWALQLNKSVIGTMKKADAVTATSHWVAQAIRRGTWAPVEVMYHGVDVEDWEPLAPQARAEIEPYVLWNKTRVDPICDPQPLERLSKLAPKVRFVTTFTHATPRDNVEVSGNLPYEHGKIIVRSAAVYLATSRETFGIGTLEAMCAGIPVLGWNWGGQAEFVKHMEHGYLAKVDDYDDLLRGLEYCLDPSNRARLGAAARQLVLDEFTWEQRILPYAQLYTSLHETAIGRPRVSVVITNYNLGQYLPKAVDSVLNSTLKDVEVIIADDASTEPLPELPDDDRIRLVSGRENLYLAGNLNRGINQARGKYIVPLDADNWLEPGALEIMASALDHDRSLDIAYGKINFINATKPEEQFVSPWPPPVAELEQQTAHKNQIPSTSMYRRRVWENTGGYRRRCHTAEDADFWTRALSVGFTGRRVTEAVTFNYLDRSDSMSHVQKDWDWHRWYSYARSSDTRLFAAGGPHIPTHEFPLVTVVVPVGSGHEHLVLDALDSIQNQTFKRWEVVVVDNTQNGVPWVPAWARVVYSPTGAASARNRGIDAAKAPLILFLDADDYLHPEALQHMYVTATEYDGFVYSDWYKVIPGKPTEIHQSDNFDPDAVLRELPYPVTCLYRKADLDKHNIRFDEGLNGKGWEDWDFAIQAVAKAGLCGNRIAAPLFHYRMATGTLRERAYADRKEMRDAMYEKWADYRSGKAENMAKCGGCGSRRPVSLGLPVVQTQQNGAMGLAAPSVDTVILEYTALQQGPRSFRGRVTNRRYRFNTATVDDRRQVVAKADAPHLLSLGWFKEYAAPQASQSFEPLEAQGAPAH